LAQRPEDPTLRIVEQELWDAVQQRLEHVRAYYTKDSSGRAKGRAVAGGATPYLFSKLLKCGACGSAMVVSGGSATAYYRCGDHVKRGTCTNSLGVREDVLRERLLDELRHTLARPASLAFARKCIAERLGEIERERRLSLDDRRLDARLRGDTLRGREELRELFKDDLITLLPQPSGFYAARSEVLPLVLITRPPPEGGGTRSLVARGRFDRCTTRFPRHSAL
jgi:Recombinase zinc beta ribbon domain